MPAGPPTREDRRDIAERHAQQLNETTFDQLTPARPQLGA